MSLLLSTAWAQSSGKRFAIEKRIKQLSALSQQRMGRERVAVERWNKTREGKMPRASARFLKTYYYLGVFYSQLYANHSSGEEDGNDMRNYRMAKHYLEICAAYEHNIDKTEERLEKLEQLKGVRALRKTSVKWRVLFQYMSYQELALLKDAGGEEKIYSPQRGFCAGGQLAWGNSRFEWTMDACIYATSGHVGAENPARYFQKDVSSKGLYIKPIYWKLLSDGEAGIGLGLPVLLRTVDYTEPAGTTVESRRAVPFGFSVDGRWRMTQKSYFTSTAAMVDGSMLWSLGALYEL